MYIKIIFNLFKTLKHIIFVIKVHFHFFFIEETESESTEKDLHTFPHH